MQRTSVRESRFPQLHCLNSEPVPVMSISGEQAAHLAGCEPVLQREALDFVRRCLKDGLTPLHQSFQVDVERSLHNNLTSVESTPRTAQRFRRRGTGAGQKDGLMARSE